MKALRDEGLVKGTGKDGRKEDEKRMKGYVTESTNSVIYLNYAGRL